MNDETQWVLLDTETDGLYYPIHVVEIAAQRMRGLEPDNEPFQVFINHDVPIPPEALAIHGYTREFLAENGVSPHVGHSRLRDYIGDRLVSSHYLSFDWNRVLVPEWGRLGAAPCGRKGMCTWLLSRRTIHETPTHRLDFLRDHFSLNCSRPHSAKGDVESTVDLLERVILPRLRGVGITSYESVQDFSRLRPVALCLCIVQGKDYETEMREARARDTLLNRLEYGSVENVPSLILEHNLIAETPEIEIDGRVFLFTGKMAWGSRSKAQKLVEELGGHLAKSKSVSGEVDYLVLGEDPGRGWTSLLGGGKLTQAFRRKIIEPEGRLNLILETDFIGAVNAISERSVL